MANGWVCERCGMEVGVSWWCQKCRKVEKDNQQLCLDCGLGTVKSRTWVREKK